MQFSLKNRLGFISLLPITILFFVTSYFVYTSYKSYTATQVLQHKLSDTRELNTLINNISKERGITTIYLGNPSKNTLNSLNKQRKILDRVADKYIKDVKNTSDIESAIKQIQNARKLINENKISFQDMYRKIYGYALSITTKRLEKIANEQVDNSINQYANKYIEFMKASNYSSDERDYISYTIAKSFALKENDIDRWISFIAKADAINYDTIKNTEINSQLNKIFKNEDAKELFEDINSERASILVAATNGKYTTNVDVWFAMITDKINMISNAENTLLTAMDKQTVKIKTNALQVLAISLTIWLVSVVLAIFSFLLSNEIARNILNLENVLKRVANDAASESTKRDINLNTAKGTEEAYNLLEHIIEQTRQDKESAQEASEAKSMFLANMSHEIRTPLNGIVGFTELLKDTGLEEEQSEFVEIIEKSSENLLEIINNILDLSKIESNKLEIEDVIFNPIDEFESAVEVYSVRASEKQINLGCFIDPALEKPLKGDPTKLKEVVINLLSNAVKFTSTSGSINVNIRKENSVQDGVTRIRFEVQDSGIGVTSEQKSKIFEAFSQADTSITRKYGGTGLGLTISARFIELMGGQLDLESEPGEGTTFFFTVDFEEVETNLDSAKDTFSEINALVLESQEKSKTQDNYLIEYLEFYGVSYRKIKDINEANKLRKNIDYDLLIVDYEYCSRSELKEYAALPQKLVLITKSSHMKTIDSLEIDIFKTIYEPLNNTKLRNSLDSYKSENLELSLEDKQDISNIDVESVKFNANILVAEDNTINQKLIKRTLEDLGLTVSLAANGLEAFQKRKDGNFDLIFMDIQMPFLDGVEATKEILEFEEDYNRIHVPIIALTANALKGDRERFLEAGLDEYTTKPLVRSEIVLILTQFLADKITNRSDITIEHKDKKANSEDTKKEETDVSIEESSTQTSDDSADLLLAKKTSFETKLFQKVLDSLEYSYEIANSNDELIKMAEENNYKVILFDKELKDLNIEEFVNAVKNQNKESKLILMSAEDENDNISGIDKIIPSVVDKELLHSIMDKFIK